MKIPPLKSAFLDKYNNVIHKYLFTKVAHSIITKIAQGDSRGLWLYIKKAAFGIVVGIVILIIFLIIALIFLIQIIFSTFTKTINIESFQETKSAIVTEIVSVIEKVNLENIKNSIQNKETIVPVISIVEETQNVFNTIETYIKKLENLFP